MMAMVASRAWTVAFLVAVIGSAIVANAAMKWTEERRDREWKYPTIDRRTKTTEWQPQRRHVRLVRDERERPYDWEESE